MADTNLLVLAREYKKLREEVKKVLSMPKGDKGDRGEKGEKGDKGDTGPQGFPGRDGKDGINGFNGKDGRDGIDGKDGKDGLDGVGVANAYIDFDNSLVIVLSDGREVNAGFLSQETKENVVATFKQGAATINELLPPQEGNANKFLKTDGTNVSWDTLDGSDIDLASPPVIGNTTPNAATFTTLSTGALTATGQTKLGGASGAQTVQINTTTNTGQYVEFDRDNTNNIQFVRAVGANLGLGVTGSGSTRFFSSSTVEQFRISATASAVNYVQVTGGATNNSPTISWQGSDANIQAAYLSKGTGVHSFFSGNGARKLLQLTDATNAVNFSEIVPAATNQEPIFRVQGQDTNISMAFQSKGTGGISLSTGSTGTNLVNGTTVTAITRTSAGSGYTSFPSIAISAPTTAGGVQATASVTGMAALGVAVVVNGGTGYTAGDVLTPVGGTGGTATRITVSSVSGGVITGAYVSANESYSVLPSNPVSVTGGTGTGATFNLNYAVTGQTITNAGSGYVEQPTVTFSGGGGSGAAAYAQVGNAPIIRSIGGPLLFYTAGGEAFRISDVGASTSAYWQVFGGTTTPILRAVGSGSGQIQTNSAVPLQFMTNAGAQEQLRVAHTASAVNYVQVTGAATGNATGPSFTAAGSDANIPITISSKGTGAQRFVTGAGLAVTFVDSGGTTANFLQIQGRQAGNGPIISAQGSDANVDINLTPKGTGNVRFGTYTATVSSITGYIEIKDSGGTVRRLAVVA